MKNWKLIEKIATYGSVASSIIAIALAVLTFFTLQISLSFAPIEYVVVVILSTIMPYLFAAILLAIVVIITRGSNTPEEVNELENAPTEIPQA